MFTVSYSGVHQAYQSALALQESSLLDKFYYSLLDSPGKISGRLNEIIGSDFLKNRRCESLKPSNVIEYPSPELIYKIRGRVSQLPGNAWIDVGHVDLLASDVID
jgi:hypothetical protein